MQHPDEKEYARFLDELYAIYQQAVRYQKDRRLSVSRARKAHELQDMIRSLCSRYGETIDKDASRSQATRRNHDGARLVADSVREVNAGQSALGNPTLAHRRPFDPSYYKYSFRVDGQEWADPSNVPDRWYSGSSDQVSQLEVPAAEPSYHDFRPDVPHGAVRTHTFYSHMADSIARMVVYTPPSYDREPTRSFPVLYLFHGFSGTEFDGTRRFRAPWIADNPGQTNQADTTL